MPTCEPSPHLLGTGDVAELEAKLRQHYGVRHAVCVSSGSTGLLAVALALGLKRSEFITTPYTYGASLGGWLLLENRPVFADIDPETLGIDPEAMRSRVTRRTKAMLTVDIFGIPSDTASLRRIADEFGLWYVADAAQSFGARRDGRPASALADALVLSFTRGKTLDAGEGGAVLTDNSDLYEKLIWFTQHPSRQRRELGLALDNEFGLNGRIHPSAAKQANEGFDKALTRLAIHQRDCFELIEALNETGCTQPIGFGALGIEPSFFRMTAAWIRRGREKVLGEQLEEYGLPAIITPPPVRLVYEQPAFEAAFGRASKGMHSCPEAEKQSRLRFSLVRKERTSTFPIWGNDDEPSLVANSR